MKLSYVAILLGVAFALPQLWALFRPADFAASAKRFPRSLPWGFALMGLATVWFLYNLKNENISDFAPYKPVMLAGFGAIGIGCCVYVRDFLAVRGLAVLLLLLAKEVLDAQRWADTPWKNVLAIWAYLWVIAGIWLTVSPWRLRDWLDWNTASPQRLRVLSTLRLLFALGVIGLGLLSF